MTYLKQIDVKTFPSLSIDAFGRWRTSMPHTIFDSKLENSKQPLLWSEKLYATGSSTHTTANARARMETAASGDAAIRQTFMRFGYQPGKGQLVYFTFLAPQAANVRQRIGLFEGSDTANSVPQNGVFLEVGASDMSWNIAKGGSITETKLQSNAWGGLADSGILMDKLDGTGPSGITLDMDACQIGWFDLEWLGAGTVRAGFIINGVFYQTCEFNHANDATFTAVYTRTASLPLNYSIYQSGAGSGILDHICSTVISEGGLEETGITREHNMGSTTVTCASTSTVYALLGIKLKSAFDNTVIIPKLVTAACTDVNAKDYLLEIRMNPTVGGTFSYSDKTNSAVQTATGVVTNTVTGGETLWSGYGSSDGGFALPSNIIPRIGKAIDGTLDALVLCCRPLIVNTAIAASLNWLEQV